MCTERTPAHAVAHALAHAVALGSHFRTPSSPSGVPRTSNAGSLFPRRTPLKLSEKSRMPLQPSLTGHQGGLLGPFWRLYTGQRATVETLLRPLFGQFLSEVG